jgi:NifU-like protein
VSAKREEKVTGSVARQREPFSVLKARFAGEPPALLPFFRSTDLQVSYYPPRINQLFLDPPNVGEVREPDARGDTGSIVCGAALRLTLKIDAASHRIVEAKFRAAGCGYLTAAAAVVTELISEITVEEAATLTPVLDELFVEMLEEFPLEKRHCAELCRDALGSALTGYRTSAQTEWIGDEALICTCFGVAERVIEATIESGALQSVNEVTRACNAGAGCGSCHPLIADILDDYWRTRAVEPG